MRIRESIVAAGWSRTPFGRFGGALKDVDIYDLGAAAMKRALLHAGLAPDQVSEVWWGCGDTTNCKDPYTPVVARQSLLKAGLPAHTPSVTLDKACVSGMSAVNYGVGRILLGEAEVVLAGGATSFSTVPYLARGLRWSGTKSGGVKLEDPLFPLGYRDHAPVAVDAGNVALRYGVTRREQDELALCSHQNYAKALERGFYDSLMAPVEAAGGERAALDRDEQFRPSLSLEALSKLKPIFDNPTITAGNAPGLNDGAAAQVFLRRETAETLGLRPLYELLDIVSIAAAPPLLPVAPALAVKRALEEAELSITDIDVIEINEAFAAVPLVSCKLLACRAFWEEDYCAVRERVDDYPLDTFDPQLYSALLSRLNVNGGAIAIGHANTASGARIMQNAGEELRRRGGGLGVCAICGGLTQGDACVIRV